MLSLLQSLLNPEALRLDWLYHVHISDFVTKEKMADISFSSEITTANHLILHLGSIPETVEEWKFLLHLAQSRSPDFQCHGTQNGNTIGNGSTNWSNCITVENVALLLSKVIGPDRALPVLQECDLTAELSERFTRICEILRIQGLGFPVLGLPVLGLGFPGLGLELPEQGWSSQGYD
uniref:HPS5 TPR domain-containing protein n=1 Tax=Chelonoidis abingdonii TaxID=106734 RepID=A0A8C0HHL6_CHEAB